MTFKKAISAITAIIGIMAMISMTVCAATTATTKATVKPEVEVTSSKAEERNATKYPKSLQMKLLESKDHTEVERAVEVVKSLKANTAKVDAYGIAWKSGASEDVVKVRVKAGNIDFQWTPVFAGYAWIADLSMWSNKGLLGKEATLYFLDKESKVLWSTTVVLQKDVKIPEVDTAKATAKEEIVPPCPNDMKPQYTPTPGVEVGVAPGK